MPWQIARSVEIDLLLSVYQFESRRETGFVKHLYPLQPLLFETQVFWHVKRDYCIPHSTWGPISLTLPFSIDR